MEINWIQHECKRKSLEFKGNGAKNLLFVRMFKQTHTHTHIYIYTQYIIFECAKNILFLKKTLFATN